MEYPVISSVLTPLFFGTARALPSCFRIPSEHAAAFYTVGGFRCFYPFSSLSLPVFAHRTDARLPESTRLYQLFLPVYLYDAYGRSFSYSLFICLAFLVGYESSVSGFPSSRLCRSASPFGGSLATYPKWAISMSGTFSRMVCDTLPRHAFDKREYIITRDVTEKRILIKLIFPSFKFHIKLFFSNYCLMELSFKIICALPFFIMLKGSLKVILLFCRVKETGFPAVASCVIILTLFMFRVDFTVNSVSAV